VEQAEARRQVALLAWMLLRLGEVRLLAGQPDGAKEPLSKAAALFREHKERGGEAYSLRALGEAHHWRADSASAREAVKRAHDVAQHLSMEPLSKRCEFWRAALENPYDGAQDGPELSATAKQFNDCWVKY
jgi:hypothetical protein